MTFESLTDKTVLVTGGARGIGKGLARACLQEGAQVIITNLDAGTGRETARELSSLGTIRSVQCDSTDRKAVDSLLDDIWSTEGPLDLVFCNAGRGGGERVLDASLDDVHALFSINYDSAIILAQSYIPRILTGSTPGHLMFTASEHSVGLPEGNESLNFAIYGSTKHALLILAEWLRADLANTPVSVSLLMPGPVLTEGLAATFKLLDEDPENAAIRAQFSKEVEQLLRARIITAEQCAQIALRGLRQGLFYIPAQSYIKQDIDRRYHEMSDAFSELGLS